MKKPDLIVVVHLSATAIHTVIGQIHSAQDIRIIGLSTVKNHDFAQGTIRHRERLKSAIKQSIQNAEDMANCRVNSVWLSFSTPDLQSVNSVGEVKIKHDIVQAKDVVAALEMLLSSPSMLELLRDLARVLTGSPILLNPLAAPSIFMELLSLSKAEMVSCAARRNWELSNFIVMTRSSMLTTR